MPELHRIFYAKANQRIQAIDLVMRKACRLSGEATVTAYPSSPIFRPDAEAAPHLKFHSALEGVADHLVRPSPILSRPPPTCRQHIGGRQTEPAENRATP